MILIPTKKLLAVFLLKRMQFLKFNYSMNLSFFILPRNERSMYIRDFKPSWRTKSSHWSDDFSTFSLIYYKQISSLVFVCSGVDPFCFYEDVHIFTSSFIISTRLLFLHLRIPTSSSLLLLSSLWCSWSASEFDLEVLLVAWIVLVILFTKPVCLVEGLDFFSFIFFWSFFLCSVFQFHCTQLPHLIFHDRICQRKSFM